MDSKMNENEQRVKSAKSEGIEISFELVNWMCTIVHKLICAVAFLVFLAGETNAIELNFKEVSLTTKRTNYTVPVGAFFVSPTGNDGHPGTLAAPWRTLQKANSAAPARSTVVIRGGTYRGVDLVVDKTLTFQAYPGEEVSLKGSEVLTNWIKDGSGWRHDDWIPKSRMATGGNPGFIDPAYPTADYPDQVFVDGVPLTQVLQKSQVAAGKFYVDHNVQKLWIGSDPTGKLVESSSIARAMFVAAPGTKLLGLAFMHYAPTTSIPAAVVLNAPNILVENCLFALTRTPACSSTAPSTTRHLVM